MSWCFFLIMSLEAVLVRGDDAAKDPHDDKNQMSGNIYILPACLR